MIRRSPRHAWMALGCVLCACGFPFAWADEGAIVQRRWRAGVETGAAPFTFAAPNGEAAGFAVELLQAVAAERTLEIDYVVLPWPELLAKFRAGEIDIICNVVATPERRAFVAFSATTALMQGAMFIRQDHTPIYDSSELRGLRIAVVRDSRAHEYLRRQSWGVEFVFAPAIADCLAAVHDGRADAILASDLVVRDLMKQRGIAGVVASPLRFPDFDYREHFGVAPHETALLAELNEGLLAVQRNYRYAELHEKWIGPLRPRQLGWREVRPYVIPLIITTAIVLVAFAWQRRMLLQVARQAEALRLSEERLSLVFEGSQDGFWDWDARNGEILRSPRWFAMLGYSPADVAPGRLGFLDLVHPDDRQRILAHEADLWRERDHFSFEARLRAKNGEWKWILDRGKVVARDPHTKLPLRIVGTHTDITPRKRAEIEAENLQRRMQETQRLESLGVLAGGIAHDFNNLLTVVLGNASLLQLDERATPAANARIEKIKTAANRAADLCRQLLAYAGKGAFTIEPLSLNSVARDTVHLLELSTKRHAELEFSFARDLPLVDGDPSQFQQVIMNLVINASEALAEKGGRIRIATQRVDLMRGELMDALPSPDLAEGCYACVEVTDNGCGIDELVRARIFDPFFTTKFTGRGLGLAAVLGIVRSHRGALTVRSTPGQGSTFRIYLPASTRAATFAATEVRAPAPSPGPRGAVLVADDDESLRPLFAEVLKRLGHDPVVTADGNEAIAVFTEGPDRFVAALLDLTMPGKDGLETLRELRRRRPNLPCVLVSGYSEVDARARGDTDGFTGFLQKPFTPDSLNAVLRRATERT
jgi:two-component system, cell cycle sensor histidine kinase and response regulator CckA